MRIKMLQTRYGSEDGFTPKRFHKDEEYTIADSLGAYFIDNKVAVKLPADDRTIGESMDTFGLRIEYGKYLKETRSCLSYENWLTEVKNNENFTAV